MFRLLVVGHMLLLVQLGIALAIFIFQVRKKMSVSFRRVIGCAQEKKLFSNGDEPKVFCLFRVNFPSTEQFETKIIKLDSCMRDICDTDVLLFRQLLLKFTPLTF